MKRLVLLPIIFLISVSMIIGVSFAESKFEHKQKIRNTDQRHQQMRKPLNLNIEKQSGNPNNE